MILLIEPIEIIAILSTRSLYEIIIDLIISKNLNCIELYIINIFNYQSIKIMLIFLYNMMLNYLLKLSFNFQINCSSSNFLFLLRIRVG